MGAYFPEVINTFLPNIQTDLHLFSSRTHFSFTEYLLSYLLNHKKYSSFLIKKLTSEKITAAARAKILHEK